jgi:signal transduction histidine kinase
MPVQTGLRFEFGIRGRRAANDRVPGSGLGLYIAREIVRAHGGDLWLESALGSGSEFCLMLPAQKGAA